MASWLVMIVIAIVGLFTPAAQGAEDPLVLTVWPGATVGDFGNIGPERVRAPEEAPTKTAKWITNVTKPEIHVFRPAPEKNKGAALLICPGGGYWNLAWDLEGEEVARWANTRGMTGVVLKYRVPRRPGQPEPLPAPGPLLDAQRAMRLIRHHANEWGIDPARVGIVGFSAGGHLAIATATNFNQPSYEPIEDIDRLSCRPDFAVAVYPGYLAVDNKKPVAVAPYMRIPENTPPIFLVHASDDLESPPEHSTLMYNALNKAGIPAELHIYARGGHGFGVRPTDEPCSTWTARCTDWLGVLGMLPRPDSTNVKAQALAPLPEGDSGIAARYPGDIGIADDPKVVFHADFERDDWRAQWDASYHDHTMRITHDPENAHRGQRALEFRVPQQPAELSNAVMKRFDSGFDTLHLRFYSKFERGFDQVGSSHNGGYLAAIAQGVPYATPGIKADGRNKFAVSLECMRFEPEVTSPGHLKIYCYHPEQRSEYGDHFFPSGKVLPFSYRAGDFGPDFQPRTDIIPDLDRWYCYELMVQANTPGHRDGRIAFWLDGKLMADFPNLRLRDTESLKINHAALDLHIGSNRLRENIKWYDDVVIATSYIGPRVEGR